MMRRTRVLSNTKSVRVGENMIFKYNKAPSETTRKEKKDQGSASRTRTLGKSEALPPKRTGRNHPKIANMLFELLRWEISCFPSL